MRNCTQIITLCAFLLGLVCFSTTAQSETIILVGVPEIIDGDTVRVEGTTIRLEGIDAPEKRQLCKDKDGEFYSCGAVATSALKARIAGNHLSCIGKKKDRYKRLIGTCYFGKHTGLDEWSPLRRYTDINKWMVVNGLALAYRQYTDFYLVYEYQAEEKNAGMWAGEFVKPWEWRKGKRLEGEK